MTIENKLNCQGAPMSPALVIINKAIIMATITKAVALIRLIS